MTRMPRGWTLLVVAVLALASCGSTDADVALPFGDPGADAGSIILHLPEEASSSQRSDALSVVMDRLSEIGLSDVRIETDQNIFTVALPVGVDARAVAEVLSVGGRFSMRPVLGMDFAAGETTLDDPKAESVLLDSASEFVYRLGPAAVAGSDLATAEAQFKDVGVAGSWVVLVEFTDGGAARFQELTRQAAAFSFDDPRRQVAIVVDGVVWSAPLVAADVSPEVGITGGTAVITFGAAEDAATQAAALAVALRTAALPVMFDQVSVATGG